MKWQALTVTLILSLSAHAANPSPSITRARTKAIEESKRVLENECRQEAGGDWQAWYEQLQPFRTAMLKLADQTPDRGKGLRLLELQPDPPLYEDSRHAWYLISPDGGHVAAPDSLVLRSVVTVSCWLRKRKVDLIFVPVPKVSEVYPDRLVKEVPPSHIVGPHIRKLIHELLKGDVEVVDLLPLFLAEREKRARPLHYATDPHWTNEAEQIAARAIAERLRRYPFVQKALSGPRLYHTETVPFRFSGVQLPQLTPEEQKRVDPLLDVSLIRVVDKDGQPLQEREDARVIIIGDSYTHCSKILLAGTGINALLGNEINQPTANISSAGATIEPFKEIVRDRDEILKPPLVIVWIINSGTLTEFPGWTLPPLPE